MWQTFICYQKVIWSFMAQLSFHIINFFCALLFNSWNLPTLSFAPDLVQIREKHIYQVNAHFITVIASEVVGYFESIFRNPIIGNCAFRRTLGPILHMRVSTIRFIIHYNQISIYNSSLSYVGRLLVSDLLAWCFCTTHTSWNRVFSFFSDLCIDCSFS
jgi:hypothetical protein